ncbi:hypothetical protein BOX15_Mlig011053g3 [Macrostomum lignano]|uniref:Tetraspanin n=2 Tax=Macrostomum lignano TaxID=282301 RepID=A0A1I8JB42_9PLAT|nr:hypothetical protein BOX15_Mlig011053g3 [Macrostomum lignano]
MYSEGTPQPMYEEDVQQKKLKPILLQNRPLYAKMIMFLVAMFAFCLGGSLVAIGVYIQLDRGFISEIIGSVVALAAAYLCIVAGFLIAFVGLLGAYGAHKLNKACLIAFLVIMLVLTLVTFVGSLLAVIFRATVIQTAKDTMSYSLTIHYGKTRLITESWDAIQTHLRCCAVDSNGWQLYIGSQWDLMVNADARNLGSRIPQWSPLYKFVPESCCLSLIDPRTLWPSGKVRNKEQCQYFPYGPPNKLSGAFNDAVNYKGCFQAGAEVMGFYSNFLGYIGFSLFIIMIIGIISSLALIVTINKDMKMVRKQAGKDYRMPGGGGY